MLTCCFDTKVVLKQVVDSVKVKRVVWFMKQEILVHAKHFLYFMCSKLFFTTTEQFLATDWSKAMFDKLCSETMRKKSRREKK